MDELARRVSALDDDGLDAWAGLPANTGRPAHGWAPDETTKLSYRFVRAMSEVTNRGLPDDETPTVDPEVADSAIAASQTIRRLQRAAPWLDSAPADGAATQHVWMATGLPHGSPRARTYKPTPSAFTAVDTLPEDVLARRPRAAGLHTCTTVGGFEPMWATFLKLNAVDEQLWPKPWRAWRMILRPGLRIAQVASAADWAGLVCAHPLRRGRAVHPDWNAIAGTYDAVHLTPAAVAATDGLALLTAAGRIAVHYWTVETTFWLRWSFQEAKEVTIAP